MGCYGVSAQGGLIALQCCTGSPKSRGLTSVPRASSGASYVWRLEGSNPAPWRLFVRKNHSRASTGSRSLVTSTYTNSHND